MNTTTIGMGVLAALFVCAPAQAQQAQTPQAQANCEAHRHAKQVVDGEVVKVDGTTNTITIKASDGTTHEFKASKETLADLKAGDHIEAKLRPAQNC